MLAKHGLDITKTNLTAELGRALTVDREVPGFEDFCLAGKRGIEPGQPAASLLYHALASPNVHPTPHGQPATAANAYPTLVEFDVVENYIYGLRPVKADPQKHVVVVFAYQYRPASATAHGYHADMAFSRTGVARVGTGPAAWDGACRVFRSDPPGRDDLAVFPARYAAFLAIPKLPRSFDSIMGRRDQDDPDRIFYFPIQKLFAGKNCILNATIAVDFKEYHVND